jgi:hypothetical protein
MNKYVYKNYNINYIIVIQNVAIKLEYLINVYLIKFKTNK